MGKFLRIIGAVLCFGIAAFYGLNLLALLLNNGLSGDPRDLGRLMGGLLMTLLFLAVGLRLVKRLRSAK
ncbi:MAG: hypothetical protein HC876_05675 [Chloroflexaceae bacterium]|nr:hypothetical protein [Chloroflexaceae bacterium]NJO05043.1 hypothetical protein [Chloroflexaceae bacterium]